MGSEPITAVADRMFDAIAAHDLDIVEALLADDLTMWHSVTGSTMDREGALVILRWFTHPAVKIRYETHETLVVGDRLSRRHTIHVAVDGHDPVEMPACIWLTIRDGQVRAIHEYTDNDIADTLVTIIPR